MYENAPEIFKYLPIESGSESRYIKQLWDSFILLSEGKDDVPYFSIVPFHLLFMLAVQYKAYRIGAWDKDFYLKKINEAGRGMYKNDSKPQLIENIPLNKNLVWDISQTSVKTLSLINEKQIFNLFEIIGIDEDIRIKACDLVESRNERLHANGEVDEEAENKIGEYLKILDHIHKKCSEKAINKDIQGNWAEDIEEGDLNLSQFFQSKFLYSQFSPSDFGDVIGDILSAENLDFDQWTQIVNLGLEHAYDQTIFELKFIASSEEFDEGKKYNADKILRENNEESTF